MYIPAPVHCISLYIIGITEIPPHIIMQIIPRKIPRNRKENTNYTPFSTHFQGYV